MKTIVLYFLLSITCSAQVAFVQNAGAGASNNNPATTTAASFTGANAIVIGLANYNASACTAPTSSPSNTWTALGSDISNGTVHLCGYTCAVPCNVSGSMTFSITNSYPYIFVVGFSGAATSSTYTGYVSTTSSSGTCAPGSVTPTASSSAVVTVLADNASATASISSYTITNQNNVTSFMGKAMAYLLTGSASSPSWSETSTAQACFAVAVNNSGGVNPAARHRSVN